LILLSWIKFALFAMSIPVTETNSGAEANSGAETNAGAASGSLSGSLFSFELPPNGGIRWMSSNNTEKFDLPADGEPNEGWSLLGDSGMINL
jgi:hypothetical protein